jgi:hypothetical protein
MGDFTKEDLQEALDVFSVLIHKVEKTRESPTPGSPQWTTRNEPPRGKREPKVRRGIFSVTFV